MLQFAEFQQMIRDWDKIIFESDEEDARIQAALEAAAPKPYVATNEPSPEERERRRSREIELGLAPSSRRRRRRTYRRGRASTTC